MMKIRFQVLTALLAYYTADSLLLTSSSTFATDGPQLIGFSAESTALAGAGQVAVADTSAINTNPAALSMIHHVQIDVTAGFLKPLLHHSDTFGNNTDGQNNPFALGNLGIAGRIFPGLTIGAGIFSQGGFGTDTRNLLTAFGTIDQASSFLRYFKIAGAASYEITDKLSFGVALHLAYSDVSLRLFPGTSTPGFAGFNIRDLCARNGGLGALNDTCPSDYSYGAKIGIMYKLLPWLNIGATYTTPVQFHYNGGLASLNFSAFGLGQVVYNAQVAGFTWPQQVDVSLAAKPTGRIVIAMTTTWINWATIDTIDVSASNPRNPLAPSTVRLSIPFNWKDQVVVAVGASYVVLDDESLKNRDRLTLRAGYNFSNNPVPDETLSPLAPVTLQHRLTGGFGYRFTNHWSFESAVLYAFENSVTYTNPSLPFGPNATESTSGYYVYNTLSYRF